jgi:hypothetical protein
MSQNKKPSQPGKINQNASFVSNSSTSNYQKDSNKPKSKYSGIGPKT